MLNIRNTLCGTLLLAGLIAASPASARTWDIRTSPAYTDVMTATPASSEHPKTVVFIHGMFMTPKTWDKWQVHFQERGYSTLAPAWPLHDGPIKQQWSAEARTALGKLTLDDVIESYRRVLRALPEKPIVIGHSMGGLVAQKLLSEGLAAKAVAIDSAPASGLIVLQWSFIRSNWAVISPFASADEAYGPSLADFRYAFANCLPDAESQAIYDDYMVPESRLVGRGTTTKAAKIDFSKPHGPLLMIAGGRDHIIPAALNRKNLGKYSDESSVADFHQFDDKCHALVVDQNWKDVADYAGTWLESH